MSRESRGQVFDSGLDQRPVPTIHGIKTETACDSQALIQLQREYCDKRQCLRCRFGYEFLRGRTKIEGYRNMAIEPDLFAELY